MGRARRARRIAAAAVYGGGGLGAGIGVLGVVGFGILRLEAVLARRVVGVQFEDAPDADGVYRGADVSARDSGPEGGGAIQFVVLGDSTAAGVGADTARQTVGSLLASSVSVRAGRPVRLTNLAVVGALSADLGAQVAAARDLVPAPDVVVIMIGANDITHRVTRATAVRHLDQAVRDLVGTGARVVVGTCPDLGAIEPVAQPLRLMARRWSRDLAAAQTVAVVEAGGRTVSLGDLIGPDFAERPHELFSPDRFHPSPAGYARVASALLPTVYAVLGLHSVDSVDRKPQRRRGESIGPVAVAAVHAVRDPGTEVSATAVAGQPRGPRGRWAVLLRRQREPVSEPEPRDIPAGQRTGEGTDPVPGPGTGP